MERTIEQKLKAKHNFGGADIFVGADILDSVPPTLRDLYEDGHIWLLHDAGTVAVAGDLAVELRNAGYKICVHDINDGYEPEEYVRFVFGVGAGRVAEIVKKTAAKLRTECALLLTAPSSDSILRSGEGYARLSQVYLDAEVLAACPRECVAAGWGFVYSEPLSIFEDYYCEKVLAKPPSAVKKLKELPADASETNLALRLLEMSAMQRKQDAAGAMSELLYETAVKKGEKPRLLGEYKFLASGVLSVFYSCFLGSPSIDTMPPVCHDAMIDEIGEATGRAREKVINSFDFLDVSSYFRISYILGEYRLDLLEKLSALDLRSTQKRWRRIYEDAAYWLKGTVTAKDLLRALSRAGQLTEGLLHYASSTGFCERLVA